LIEQRHIFKPF